VVCPTSLLGNWERELARFAPDVPVRRYHGGDRHLEELAADEVVLVTYGVVRRDRAVLAEVGWGLVVAGRGPARQEPAVAHRAGAARHPAPARVALTGTPVENRLTELWSILDWTTPGCSARWSGSAARSRSRSSATATRTPPSSWPGWCGRSCCGAARATRGSLRSCRPRPRPTGWCRSPPEQATLYEAVVRETLAKITASEGIERRGLVLGLLTALKQICNHPRSTCTRPGPLAGRSGKLAALDELLEVILDEGEAALVFSQYVEMCRLIRAQLADRGVPTLFLHGGVRPAAARSWSPGSRTVGRRCSCSPSRPAGLA
jgi:SNF2 family DNA or RNA helicase